MHAARKYPLLGLGGWLLLCYATAALGAVASANAGEVYSQLLLPPWAPPGWLFGPVWSLLYTLMAISAWLLWRRSQQAAGALLLFALHLIPNALWSWLFFAYGWPGLALLDIILLWLLLSTCLILFWRQHRGAALLLLPYWLWVSFAGILNASIWQLNS